MAEQDVIVFDENLNPVPVRKQIRKDAFLGPWTLYPVALGMPSILAGVLFDTVWFFVAAGLAVAGVSKATISYFFMYGKNRNRLLVAKRKVLEAKLEQRMSLLQNELRRFGENYAAVQVDNLRQGYIRLKAVVKSNIDPSSPEYEQCLSGAEVMFSQALDNMAMIIEGCKNMQLVNPEVSERRIEELIEKRGSTDEVEFHKRQLEIFEEVQKRNDELISLTEKSYTCLVKTATEIVNDSGESSKHKLLRATERFVNDARMNKKIREEVRAVMSQF